MCYDETYGLVRNSPRIEKNLLKYTEFPDGAMQFRILRLLTVAECASFRQEKIGHFPGLREESPGGCALRFRPDVGVDADDDGFAVDAGFCFLVAVAAIFHSNSRCTEVYGANIEKIVSSMSDAVNVAKCRACGLEIKIKPLSPFARSKCPYQ